jgi:hypothetical protein
VVDQQRAGLNEHSSKQFFAAHNFRKWHKADIMIVLNDVRFSG